MISINASKVEKLISEVFNVKIKKFEDNLVTDLKEFLLDPLVTEDWQRTYIEKIIEKKDFIIKSKYSVLLRLKSDFDSIVDIKVMSSKKMKPFREKLLITIGYTARRNDFYPEYFQKLGIKVCVYCNSQLAVSVNAQATENEGVINVVKAKFQVDHYLPKSDYPCFSVSLYNLYPVCSTCNNLKRVKHIEFELYNENPLIQNVSKFKFVLKEGSEAKYLLNFNINDINIIFYDPVKPNADEYSELSFQDSFDITGIYDTQKDLVEELIIKSYVYNDAYKSKLITMFPQLFTNSSLSNRMLIGNYSEPDDIHKRPMAKFTQDIAKQLKLI